jgi:hypothetical protein
MSEEILGLDEIEYFYIKHKDHDKTYKLSREIIETIGLLGVIFLKDYKKVNYNKKHSRYENLDLGLSENDPLIFESGLIEINSINKKITKVDLKSHIIFEMIMDWIDLWKNNYEGSIYFIKKPIQCDNYNMIFKNQDIEFFNNIKIYSDKYWTKYGFTYNKDNFKIDELKDNFESLFNDIEPIYKIIKFMCIFIEAINSYYDIPTLLDKSIAYISILIKKITFEEYEKFDKLIKKPISLSINCDELNCDELNCDEYKNQIKDDELEAKYNEPNNEIKNNEIKNNKQNNEIKNNKQNNEIKNNKQLYDFE